MQGNSTRAFLLVGLISVYLNGCVAPIALTLLGVGAGVLDHERTAIDNVAAICDTQHEAQGQVITKGQEVNQ